MLPRVPWLPVLIASFFASGCGMSDLLINDPRVDSTTYDPQVCVENALRNHPSPADMRDAAPAFAGACNGGEAASCSVLGVMYELGWNVPADISRARSLYATACDAHNLRGCENLRNLPLADEMKTGNVARARLAPAHG